MRSHSVHQSRKEKIFGREIKINPCVYSINDVSYHSVGWKMLECILCQLVLEYGTTPDLNKASYVFCSDYISVTGSHRSREVLRDCCGPRMTSMLNVKLISSPRSLYPDMVASKGH